MTATRVPGLPVLDGTWLISTNPVTGAEAGRVPVADADAVAAAVERAAAAGRWWHELGFDARRERLLRWRALLATRAGELTALTHAETGKPEADALVEAGAAMEHLDCAARNARRVLGARRGRGRLITSEFPGHLEYQPVGVGGVIGPWNYPILAPV